MILKSILLTQTLAIICFVSFSQTKVEGEDFVKSSNVIVQVADSAILGLTNSFADYKISVPKSGYFTFDLSVMGDGYINIKTVSGTSVLATINVQDVSNWQTLSARVKLTSTSKAIRFVFYGSVDLNYFQYEPEGVVSTGYAMKNDFNKLSQRLDSLIQEVRKNTSYLDGDVFKYKDSSSKIITIFPQ